MKNKIFYFLNILLLIGGFALSIWCIYMWSNIGFRFEPKYYNGNQDGHFFMIFLVIGIAACLYALGEFPKYRKTSYVAKTRIKKNHKK